MLTFINILSEGKGEMVKGDRKGGSKWTGRCKNVFLDSPFYLQKGASKVKINLFFGPFLLNTKHLAWSDADLAIILPG